MKDDSLDAQFLSRAEIATTEAELRNIIGESNAARREKRLTVTEHDVVLGFCRSKIRKLGPAITEHGAEARASTETDMDASAPSKAPLGHAIKDLVDAEVLDEPSLGAAQLVIREPALPVIDAARLGVAMKMWQQLGKVIEENTPQCITMIAGKPWRNAEFWRAARLAYGVDRPQIEKEYIEFAQGRATVTVRVNMGRRYASATGIAERTEKGKADAPMNHLAGLAYTRAANRATREVIGLGSKSAEEVDADD